MCYHIFPNYCNLHIKYSNDGLGDLHNLSMIVCFNSSYYWFTFCFAQAMQCNPAKQSSWNILSLFTNSGMLFLEISLVAFLLQGNHATGSDALTRTFVVSGIIVAADMLLKVCFSIHSLILLNLCHPVKFHSGLFLSLIN